MHENVPGQSIVAFACPEKIEIGEKAEHVIRRLGVYVNPHHWKHLLRLVAHASHSTATCDCQIAGNIAHMLTLGPECQWRVPRGTRGPNSNLDLLAAFPAKHVSSDGSEYEFQCRAHSRCREADEEIFFLVNTSLFWVALHRQVMKMVSEQSYILTSRSAVSPRKSQTIALRVQYVSCYTTSTAWTYSLMTDRDPLRKEDLWGLLGFDLTMPSFEWMRLTRESWYKPFHNFHKTYSSHLIMRETCRKFGKYLEENLRTQWRQNYLNYKILKDLIKESVDELQRDESTRLSFSPRTTSLTVQRPNRGSKNSEEEFYERLENEVLLTPFPFLVHAWSFRKWSRQIQKGTLLEITYLPSCDWEKGQPVDFMSFPAISTQPLKVLPCISDNHKFEHRKRSASKSIDEVKFHVFCINSQGQAWNKTGGDIGSKQDIFSWQKSGKCEVVWNSLNVQVAKINKFTSSEVSTLKKRLKALRDSVKADKSKSNNSSLLEVYLSPSWYENCSDGEQASKYPFKFLHESQKLDWKINCIQKKKGRIKMCKTHRRLWLLKRNNVL